MTKERKLSPTHEPPYRGLRDALIPQLREVFLTRPTDAWLARLHAADLIAERILNPGEWLRNVHVEATRAAVCQQTPGVGPVYSPRTPGIAASRRTTCALRLI
ncbi:CoA transferase [Bradyrhizobium sp. AZCC 1693]|uniref:CoA transferase n=1 Tax=Bradyrhizobium sp. AZCC 1693 TaxID=3117029 RepID=UPI002FF2C393